MPPIEQQANNDKVWYDFDPEWDLDWENTEPPFDEPDDPLSWASWEDMYA